MKTEECGKIFKTHYYFDPENNETVKGYVRFHCHHNNCPDDYCKYGRIDISYQRFKDAFSDEIYYKDFQKHYSFTEKDLLIMGYVLFDEVIVLDCYTFYRLIVSCPKNGIDLKEFIHVKKQNRFMWRCFEIIKTTPKGYTGKVGGRRIYYRNIRKNPKIKRIPTIDTHFVKEFKGQPPEAKGKHVKFSLSEDVRFKVWDGSFRMIGIQEAQNNDIYRWFCEKIHGFDFSRP